nr:heavy metal-binding domain-containing protein [Candidatus Hamiltonella defensa]
MNSTAESLGANAVVGINIDYEFVGTNNSMLMVSIYGTAVKIFSL